MATLPRNLFYILLALICCILFATFTWYPHTELALQALRNFVVTHQAKYTEYVLIEKNKIRKLPLNSVLKDDVHFTDVKWVVMDADTDVITGNTLEAPAEKQLNSNLANKFNPSSLYYKDPVVDNVDIGTLAPLNEVGEALTPEVTNLQMSDLIEKVEALIPQASNLEMPDPADGVEALIPEVIKLEMSDPAEEVEALIPEVDNLEMPDPADGVEALRPEVIKLEMSDLIEKVEALIPQASNLEMPDPADGVEALIPEVIKLEMSDPDEEVEALIPEVDNLDMPDLIEEFEAIIPEVIKSEISDPSEEVEALIAEIANLQVSAAALEVAATDPEVAELFTPSEPSPVSQVTGLELTEKIGEGLGLLIDTNGCKIPKHDPWDPTVINLYVKQEPYECPGPPLFMNPQPGGSISLNETVLDLYYSIKASDLKCFYRSYLRKHSEPGNVWENDYITGPLQNMTFGVPLNDEYVGVFCQLNNITFQQYFPLVRLKKEIEEAKQSKDKARATSEDQPLNVILAGIDSVSKLNFLRHFPRTLAFLEEKMSPFEMKGYTKVGDNTFPNLIPLLSGHFVEYYFNESMRYTMQFDNLDLIWKDYSREGYRTFYAEDSPFTGTFNYIKRGFYDPPTDYYYRTMGLVVEYSDIRKQSGSHCFNSQLETDHVYDYLKNFIHTMGNRPYHAFAMVSTITHDYLNNAGLADDPTVRLLTDLWDSGALNKSALILFSDHGLRFGEIRETYIGKFEERMPFMYIHFPKWFLDKYPETAMNLKTNQDRLITLFDIHATMLHLLDPTQPMAPEENSQSIRGSSILNEISPNRTCEEANIRTHFCPCQTYDSVSLNSAESLKSSQAMVDDINNQLEKFQGLCAVLEIDNILDVRTGHVNDLVLKFVRNVEDAPSIVLGDKVEPLSDYLVTLVTKPGGAVFEGTVRYDPNTGTYSVLGISRINMYRNQSWCIDSQKMKVFCYCNTQQDQTK